MLMRAWLALCLCAVLVAAQSGSGYSASIDIDWDVSVMTSKTTPTLQVVVNVLDDRSNNLHDEVFGSLNALHAEYVRFVPWLPFPKLGVAELSPPSGMSLCDIEEENWFIELDCTMNGIFPNSTVESVVFASFGTPTGSCGSWEKNASCDSPKAKSTIEKECLGKAMCIVPAEKYLFPTECDTDPLWLAAEVTCSGTGQYTYWDFEYIDPIVEDFMNATEGHSRIINFSTPPQWLYNGTNDWKSWGWYPSDPNNQTWSYEQGKYLTDLTGVQQAEYYGRLVSWYVNGGFYDEYGNYHKSGHFYDIPYWEVMNEVEYEHHHTVQGYTLQYDAIVQAIREMADPEHYIQFVGMALAGHYEWDWYEYFLNPANHQPGIPLDVISFHFYASTPLDREDADGYRNFFVNADSFVHEVPQIMAIRDRLSPNTRLDSDEVGVILPGDNNDGVAAPPLSYWNAAGAMYAYLFGQLSEEGIDIMGESQLTGYPNLDGYQPQFPSVSMLNWTTGEGNARYWVLKMIIENFAPGDFIMTALPTPAEEFCAQASEYANVTLYCTQEGAVIDAITWADFGSPSGECGHFVSNASCTVENAAARVAAECVGQSSCVVMATDTFFDTQDNCSDALKWMNVQAHCSNGSLGASSWSGQNVYAQAFITAGVTDTRRVLLVNKVNAPVNVTLSNVASGTMQYVDPSTLDSGIGTGLVDNGNVWLGPWGVAVVTLDDGAAH